MLSKSKDANVNYLAKIVRIDNLKPHPNADRLQITMIDFQEVIIGLDISIGDIMVFCPLESQINHEFLSFTNSFAHSNLNKTIDDENKGFFDDKGRVRAIRLRGQKSYGVLFPVNKLYEFVDDERDEYGSLVGVEFDYIYDKRFLQKYIIPVKGGLTSSKYLGRKPRVSRLIDGQVHLHVDTENLMRNVWKIELDDDISITYKLHGTSFWVSNVLVKRRLNIIEKILKSVGIKVIESEYDYVYGSRKVVKNEYDTHKKNHFYEYDLWGDIKEELKDSIPKGYTLYGECIGYTKGGAMIQSGYDYGCQEGQNKFYIYRITFTNEDGIVYNLSSEDISAFCDAKGLSYVPLFYTGKVKELIPEHVENQEWRREFIQLLQDKYNDKDCYMCKNKVPEEGVVIRVEKFSRFEAYKLKSFSFLEYETKMLNEGKEDLESSN